MSDSALSDTQAAVYAVLAADATLLGMIDHLGDSIPEGSTAKRAVVIGESSEIDDSTFGDPGRSERLTIHTYTEDTQDRTGWKTAKAIHGRIVTLLDSASLTVAGRVCVLCQYESAQSIHDTSGGAGSSWRHIAADFRIDTEIT